MTDGITKLLEPFKEKRYCLLCDEPIKDLDTHYRGIHIDTYSPLTYVEMYTKVIEP